MMFDMFLTYRFVCKNGCKGTYLFATVNRFFPKFKPAVLTLFGSPWNRIGKMARTLEFAFAMPKRYLCAEAMDAQINPVRLLPFFFAKALFSGGKKTENLQKLPIR